MAISTYRIQISEQGEELLEHGSTAFPVACYHDDLKADKVPWHWHDQVEIALVTEGQVVVAAGKEKLIIPEGDGFFVNVGVLHSVWDVDCSSCRLHSMVFLPRFVAGGVDSVIWQKYVYPLITDKCQNVLHFSQNIPWQNEILQSIENAWQGLAHEEAGFEFQVREDVSRVVYCLSKQRPKTLKLPSEKSLRDSERIKKMLLFIQEHYAEPITAADIAESALISESECLRCFRNTIDTTPIQYLKNFRLQKAADYLLASQLGIADIASRCGFQEMSYFAKTFRELRGMTPSEFRRVKQVQQ